jgi:hypothetical protein
LVRLLPDACGRWVPAAVPLPGPATVTLPGDWSGILGADFAGAVRFERRFATPRGLGPGEKVCLVFDGVTAWGEVTLNGQPLGRIASWAADALGVSWAVCPARFEITHMLRPRNRLEVVVHCPPIGPDGFPVVGSGQPWPAGGLTGLVSLEITGG